MPSQGGLKLGLGDATTMVRLVLFDIDGTLIRTGGAGMRAFAQVFATEFNATDGFGRLNFAGRTDGSLVREFFALHGIPATTENFQRFFDRYVFWLDHLMAASQSVVCAGVWDFIRGLKAVAPAPLLGLLTGNIRLGAEIKLRHVGLWDEFAMGGFADDHEERGEIARQQPVAGHLRFVFAAIQINRELERIGDYAESIARSVLQVRSLEPQAPYGQFVALKDLSVAMLRDALASFLRSDAELASRTIEIEEQANTVRDQIDAEVKRMNQAGELPTAAVAPLMNIARRLERATDQTKNLCEEVLYMCTGEFIKHKGADEFHILFLDQDNTCLSQLAEGLGQSLKLPRLVFGSAGIKAGPLDSRVPPFLREKGLDAAPQAPKSLAQVPNWDHAQVIVALGAPVRDAIPPHTGKTIIFTWAIANPTGHAGDLDQSRAVFEAAWHELQVHLKELVDAILQQPHPEIKA